MSSKPPHQQTLPNGSSSKGPDIQGARTLVSFLARRGSPSAQESVSSSSASRRPGLQQVSRNDSQLQGLDYQREPLSRRDSLSCTSPSQTEPGKVSRRHQAHSSHPLASANAVHNSQHGHPSLSLDTRNLPNSHPSPHPPPRSALDSPSFAASELPSPLHGDLTSLKAGLESLWNHSSKKLHVLHSTLSAQSEALRTLSVANARLESSIAQQQATLSQETQRLRVENYRLMREGQEAEEARKKALREREILGVANARLWEDKARLEGEKRELRVKLDAETGYARLCEQEIEKSRGGQSDEGVKVKVEEGEERGTDEEDTGVRISLPEVKGVIEERLKIQADEFTQDAKEVYRRLAQSQTRVTELEAQLKRYSATANVGSITPHNPTRQPPPNINLANGMGPAKTSPLLSPITPHTTLPSSYSETEREFPLVKAWSGRQGVTNREDVSSISEEGEKERPPHPTGPRSMRAPQRTVSGPVESDTAVERVRRQRRVSAPTQMKNAGSRSVSHSESPIMDPLHLGKDGLEPGTIRDTRGQIVSTYGGVGAGWRPAALSRAGTSQSHTRAPRSRPSTPPDRPSKRARTADSPSPNGEQGADNGDVEMTTNVTRAPPAAPQDMPPQEDEPPGTRDMTADERLMFSSLNRVLTKKRDGDGWKCVLCRQDKKSPTATFSEATPIGIVTQHVKEIHKPFWRDLKGGGSKTVMPEG